MHPDAAAFLERCSAGLLELARIDERWNRIHLTWHRWSDDRRLDYFIALEKDYLANRNTVGKEFFTFLTIWTLKK